MLKIAKHAGEYVGLSRLLIKHGGAEIARSLGLSVSDTDNNGKSTPETLAEDIEQLGPAYIKLAQIASTRGDLLPKEYVTALERLQDDVEACEADVIRETIEDELGVSVRNLFATFDDQPLACASLGQVHCATLRDGRQVVVKVQRPGVDEEARNQLSALRRIARVADRNTDIGRKCRFSSLVDAVEYALNLELDYRTEAANLRQLSENLSEYERITIPQPVDSMISQRVLVMQHIDGAPLRDVSGVVLNEIDTDALAEDIVQSYLKQILIDGLFHADPHPGNLLLTKDHKLGLIDGGMVVSVSPKLRRKLAALLMAVCEQEGEEAARLSAEIGFTEESFDIDAYTPAAARIIAQTQGNEMQQMSIGKIMVQLLNVSGEHGLVLPFELTLFSKALLQIENTVRALSPTMDIKKLVRSYSARLLMERAGEQASLSKLTRTALDSAELASELPRRLNRITELVAENGLRIDVDAIDEDKLLAGFQKVANRITAGLVTSALIVGASLLMRLNIGPSAFGIPIIAGMFFLIAALIGLYLVWLALVKDDCKDS